MVVLHVRWTYLVSAQLRFAVFLTRFSLDPISIDIANVACQSYLLCTLCHLFTAIPGHSYQRTLQRQGHATGAPNDNIVQNHLSIALLNVF